MKKKPSKSRLMQFIEKRLERASEVDKAITDRERDIYKLDSGMTGSELKGALDTLNRNSEIASKIINADKVVKLLIPQLKQMGLYEKYIKEWNDKENVWQYYGALSNQSSAKLKLIHKLLSKNIRGGII